MESAINNTPAEKEPRKLTPANPELKQLLPHFSKQATKKACGDNEVNAIYPHALEICGMNASSKGMGVFGGGVGIIGTIFATFALVATFKSSISGPDGGIILVAMLITPFLILAFGALATLMLRQELFTYRDEPVLFNRITRKVHVFRVKRNWRRPFSPWPLSIDTFDWDCVHAEIGGGVVPGTVPLLRYRLYLAFTESPQSKRVVERFTLGFMSNLTGSITETWEHIRRYMQEDGPPLQAGERLRADRHFSSKETWGEVFPFLMPNWKQAIAKHPILTVGCIVLFPMFFLFGLTAWIAGITSRDPRWPDDILQAAGGAPLSDAEIEKIVPKRAPEILDAVLDDPTAGMNKKELAAYRAQQRENYAGMRDDELESLADLKTLTLPARQILEEELARRGLAAK